MSTPVMFNRRLRADELEEWLDFQENNTKGRHVNKNLATQFLNLPDSIAFVSSVEDDIVGGTSIYRDKTRLGMMLASVAVREIDRDKIAYHIIKTSLPFMKTVAIRDVDALVSDDIDVNRLDFPLSFELDSWTKDTLEKIGFHEISKLHHYSFDLEQEIEFKGASEGWDVIADREGAKQLIWDVAKELGLTTSLVWASLDFSSFRKTLRTVSVEGKVRLCISYDKIGKSIIIGLLVVDPNVPYGEIMHHISNILSESDVKTIHLPLIGQGQRMLMEEIAHNFGGTLKSRTMTLMRKHL
ncbi:MAG: hypothetical protein JW779_13435 [Candidatus Thorarchaeota archaeon]|nr:hypothetical protein [Candidatus Thorarchaeota archaeon]